MRRVVAAAVVLAAVAAAGCRPVSPAVTVYVSLDEPYSRPVLEAFTRRTGVPVLPVYDTEATKSRGLAQRLIAERRRPRADVWWSSEVLQTLVLQREGILAPGAPRAAIPARFRDPEGHWTGFAARFRVFGVRRGVRPPRTLAELTRPEWRGRVAMANPLFGTTTTEAAALFQLWGEDRARRYYQERAANRTRIVDGNSVAADQAARGEVDVAQTDTDDVFVRQDAGEPLELVFPDQDGIGALLIPNTAGLVRGGPRPELGTRLLEHLVSLESELMLASLPSRQLPLNPCDAARLPAQVRRLSTVRTMEVDYPRLIAELPRVEAVMRELFLR